ncbi:glycosyltransferase family 2 protein [Candidatus Woesearchaeota archaeon]|jgi:glycosyltransferase involved in cell wall biosynthesis|nr:glycosyltransferase family 2 protein [Candidatus Woesearchaeota archaeon]MBT6045172.1 glycosyltransferase family 2 protein [Candidatus Woesearchaeota archaeon]
MNSVKFSVVIPAHNEEEVIARAIDSVLSNGYVNKEIIISNDGSTDKTENIVKGYMKKKRNIKLVNHPTGTSAAAARNRGAKKATGEILVFLDADTYMNDEFFDSIMEMHTSSVDAYMTMNRPYRGNFVSKALAGLVGPSIKRNLKDGSIYDLENCEIAGAMFFCISRKAFDKINGFNENTFYYEDNLFAKKFYEAGFKSKLVKQAKQYFELPTSFSEFFRQCKWIGKGINTMVDKKCRVKYSLYWLVKFGFILSPLLFVGNMVMFTKALIFTLVVVYITLLWRNKNPFLSLFTLPFLYVKIILVTINMVRFLVLPSRRS